MSAIAVVASERPAAAQPASATRLPSAAQAARMAQRAGASQAVARGATINGSVHDQTGGVLPGATVYLSSEGARPLETFTDAGGRYTFDGLAAGVYSLSVRLLNFSDFQKTNIAVADGQRVVVDASLSLALNADVTVTGRGTFVNLADAQNPAQNLIGVADSASQGAITAEQLDVRPVMRAGEVLETVPGVIITQHSGEGKANQYFLRGFNLDHGSDFATTVAGVPVNMPSHAHSQGYTDINFLIPELVSGVQYSKGPYYTEQGDFATAGSSNINYANVLDKPIARVEAGSYGFDRALFAASPKAAGGHLLAALEISSNKGPWARPDDYRKVNGVLRYSRGDAVNGWSLTAMGYNGRWNATEAVPDRAIASGEITRFGSEDHSDAGRTYRYSAAGEWQHGSNATLTKATVYGELYDLDLFSNFTFFLDDPVHGDQIEQADHRLVSGGKLTQRRLARWGGRPVQTTFGVQLRNDDVMDLALYHTERRVRLDTRSDASVLVTTAGVFAENDVEWTPWLRTTVGLRGDGTRYRVDALNPLNSGTAHAGLASPKATVALGPWKSTELYLNGGTGFHSNDARGTTIRVDASGQPADRVTPLVRAKGAEIGVRTVAVPHLQSTLSLWALSLDSELVYNGDSGATEPGPPSSRRGVEFANYYSPTRALVIDADVSWSRARFTGDGAGAYVPEAVGLVISGGVSVDGFHRMFASGRWRYFGPRALTDDNTVRSRPTSLFNAQAGYQIGKQLRATVDVFNVFNASDSDIDYYFLSRLPGEPLDGVYDIHSHPTPPRSVRAGLTVGF
jgi:outer membrane receptor protein involved in Fe transport